MHLFTVQSSTAHPLSAARPFSALAALVSRAERGLEAYPRGEGWLGRRWAPQPSKFATHPNCAYSEDMNFEQQVEISRMVRPNIRLFVDCRPPVVGMTGFGGVR